MAPHAEIGVGAMNGYSTHHTFGSAQSPKDLFTVNSSDVSYTDDHIKSKYVYRTTAVSKSAAGKFTATPKEITYDFKVERKVPRTGMMLVGWGGNNGSTVTAGIIANRRGLVHPNDVVVVDGTSAVRTLRLPWIVLRFLSRL